MNYFKDSFEEMKKVTWPTGNQAVKVSIITIVFTAIATLIITGLDFGFRKGYDSLTDLSPKIQAGSTEAQPEMNFDSSMIQATDAEGNPISIDVDAVEVE